MYPTIHVNDPLRVREPSVLSRKTQRRLRVEALTRRQAFDAIAQYVGNLQAASTVRQQSGMWAASGGCPIASLQDGTTPGMTGFIDAQSIPISAANTTTITTEIPCGNFRVFGTSAGTLGSVVGSQINSVIVPGGALAFAPDGTTGHSVSLCMASAPFTFTGSTNTSGKFWFEASIAVSTIAAAATSFFVGMAETDAASFTLATALPLTAGSGTAFTNTGSFLGFNLAAASVGQIKTGYNDRATTLTYVGSTDCTLLKTYTFTRLGILYDPTQNGTSSTNPATCAIQFWQDGVMLPNGITNATLVATTNLAANGLGPIFCATDAGTAAIMYLQWARWAQLFPN